MSTRDTIPVESSGYSAVYLVPKGGASSFGEACEESFPLLSRKDPLNSSDSRQKKTSQRKKMAETSQKTPGLDESVQDFKAREDRDPNGLNSDVRVSAKNNHF